MMRKTGRLQSSVFFVKGRVKLTPEIGYKWLLKNAHPLCALQTAPLNVFHIRLAVRFFAPEGDSSTNEFQFTA